jgi:glutaredoxin 3
VVRFVESLDQVPGALRAGAGRVEIEAPASSGRARAAGTSRLAARKQRRSFSSAPPPEPRVVVYSTSWCGWCRKTLAYLDERRVDYVNKDIEANPAHRRELIEKTGRTSIPVVEINGHIVNGYDPRRLDRLLASTS